MTPMLAPHPKLGAPAGGIRPPIARATALPSRAAEGNQAPGATRSRAQGYADEACPEHGEHGEDATLPGASTAARWSVRWATTSQHDARLAGLGIYVIVHPPPPGSRGTSTIELAATDDAARGQATRLHFWIDLLVELPLIAAVLATGAVLAIRSWPPSSLLATKIAMGLAAVSVNLYCATMVVLRYKRRHDRSARRRYDAHVRWSGLGIPFAGVAAYIGLVHYAGLP